MAGTTGLFVRTYGEDGPPVVILHGLLGSSDNWHPIAKRLGETHRVLVPDLRNHGRSGHRDDASLTAMADDVPALLDKHGLSHAVLLGHSLGGRIAMQAATRWPSRVSALVVVDMSLREYAPHHLPTLDAMAALPVATFQRRAEADAALAEALPNPAERQLILKCLTNGPEGLRWRINLPAIRAAYPGYLGSTALVGTFDGPALFIAGGRSDYLVGTDHVAIREHFSQARFSTVKAAGHWVHADAPEPFLDLVESFLAHCPDSPLAQSEGKR
jgi:pimeloyl-ACP methyl ester carboxylesterase